MKQIIIGVILLFSLNGFSQKVFEGKTWNPRKNFLPVNFAGFANGNLQMIRGTAGAGGILEDIIIEQFNPGSLEKTGEVEFDNLFKDRQLFYPEDIIAWNSSVCIFGSSYSKQARTNTLICRAVSSTGSLTEDRTLLSMPAINFENNRKRFILSASPARQMLLALGLNENQDDHLAEIKYVVFDRLFGKVKEAVVSLSFQGKSAVIEAVSVDDPGNVHILLKTYRSSDSNDVAYSIYAFPVMNDDIVQYDLDIPEKQISSMTFSVSRDDYLLATGLLRDESMKPEARSAIFFLKINRETAKVEAKAVHPLGDCFSDSSSEDIFRGEERFDNIKIRNIAALQDGGAIVFSEQEYSEEICKSDFRSNMIVCNRHYYCNNIFVVCYSREGELRWTKVIRKQQHSIDDAAVFLSFLMTSSDAGQWLIFNDKPDSKENRGMNDPEKSGQRFLFLANDGAIKEDFPAVAEKPLLTSFSLLDDSGNLYCCSEKRSAARLFRFTP